MAYPLDCRRSCSCLLLGLPTPALLLGLLISASPVRSPVSLYRLCAGAITCCHMAILCHLPHLNQVRSARMLGMPFLTNLACSTTIQLGTIIEFVSLHSCQQQACLTTSVPQRKASRI